MWHEHKRYWSEWNIIKQNKIKGSRRSFEAKTRWLTEHSTCLKILSVYFWWVKLFCNFIFVFFIYLFIHLSTLLSITFKLTFSLQLPVTIITIITLYELYNYHYYYYYLLLVLNHIFALDINYNIRDSFHRTWSVEVNLFKVYFDRDLSLHIEL